ncbi:hypothetical protein [Klebsiella phage KpF5]|nr:hypothetical protein [Klebsiella phage KpF5]
MLSRDFRGFITDTQQIVLYELFTLRRVHEISAC